MTRTKRVVARSMPSGIAALIAVSAVVAMPASAGGAAQQRDAAPTCLGRPATLVGTPGRNLTGTDAGDVVVTNGAPQVTTLDGDDLVCVTGSSVHHRVVTGAGDDVVDSHRLVEGDDVVVLLGSGSDGMIGGPAAELVVTDGHDVVRSGSGADSVLSGQQQHVNRDVIDLSDSQGGSVDARGRLRPGAAFHVTADTSVSVSGLDGRARWTFHAAAGRLTRAGHPAITFTGSPRWLALDGDAPVSFQGTRASESVLFGRSTHFAGARLGAGDDTLLIRSACAGPGHAVASGGRGQDGVTVALRCRRVRADLGSGTVTGSDAGTARSSQLLRAFEQYAGFAPRLSIVGTSGDDRVTYNGCQVRIDAGSGDDVVAVGEVSEDETCGARSSVLLHGGPGRDDLTASALVAHARMFGGTGRDRATGVEGRGDECSAEVMVFCTQPG